MHKKINFFLFCILILTNQRLSYQGGIQFLDATDTASYMAIASAAPALPLKDSHIPFHHAQRFFVPYTLGLLHHFWGISFEILFFVATLLSILASTYFLHKIFSFLRLETRDYFICMSLLFFQPWVFRYYLAIPFMMGTDLFFVNGLSITLWGLFSGSFSVVLIGSIIAILGKQTAVFLLPGIILWLWVGSRWKGISISKHLIYSLLVMICMIGGTVLTYEIASLFSADKATSIVTLFGIFVFFTSDFSLTVLIEFVLRGLIALFFPACIFGGLYLVKGQKFVFSLEQKLCLGMGALICLQPLLSGPIFTGNNIVRLNSLAMLPLVIFLAISMKQAVWEPSQEMLFALGILIFTGSLHYKYIYNGVLDSAAASFTGLSSGSSTSLAASIFILFYVLSGVTAGVITWKSVNSATK